MFLFKKAQFQFAIIYYIVINQILLAIVCMDSIILEPRTEPVCPVSKIVRPWIEIWKPWIDIICPRYNWNKIHIKYNHYIKVQGATDNTFKVSKHSFFFNESEEILEVAFENQPKDPFNASQSE